MYDCALALDKDMRRDLFVTIYFWQFIMVLLLVSIIENVLLKTLMISTMVDVNQTLFISIITHPLILFRR